MFLSIKNLTKEEKHCVIYDMNNYYVYGIKDIITNQVFYIGKGKNKRYDIHLDVCIKYEKPPKGYNCIKLFNKIKFMLKNKNIPVIVKFCENLNEIDALNEEVRLIAQYGRKNLCNLTNGGEGLSGHIHSPETRRKLSKSLTGRPMSEKTKNALFKANVGRKMKPEWVEKSVDAKCRITFHIKNHTTNQIFITKNLRKFCRDNNLKYSTMQRSFDQKSKTLKGPNINWELIKIIR